MFGEAEKFFGGAAAQSDGLRAQAEEDTGLPSAASSLGGSAAVGGRPLLRGGFVDAGPTAGLLRVHRPACKRLWGLRTDPAAHPTPASLFFLGVVGSVVAPEPFRSPRVLLRRDRSVADASGRVIVVHVRRGDACDFYLRSKSPYQLIYWEVRAPGRRWRETPARRPAAATRRERASSGPPGSAGIPPG